MIAGATRVGRLTLRISPKEILDIGVDPRLAIETAHHALPQSLLRLALNQNPPQISIEAEGCRGNVESVRREWRPLRIAEETPTSMSDEGTIIADLQSSATAILAISRKDPRAADLLLAAVARRARELGLRLVGALQRDVARDDRRKCDKVLTDLSSGREIRISEDRGNFSVGCRLDRGAMTEASAWVERAVRTHAPDLMILNKFARAEEEGGGMRDAIAAALENGVPVLLGVAQASVSALEAFAGAFCTFAAADPVAVETWLRLQLPDRLTGAILARREKRGRLDR